MILDVILLTLREIALAQQRDITIIPRLRFDGVQISPPDSEYGLWPSGKLDYAVIEYEKVKDNWGESE
jgi:hypothetical protein